jgi:CHASE2 domain-containing sensor protein/nitrogen-specific signal transduction histidine kinase
MKHPVLREWAIILGVLWLGVIAAARYGAVERLDLAAYDLAMRLWERPAMREVVIIGIDEASLAQLGRWPWPRVIHATLLDKLAEAKPSVIGLDIILSEADRSDARADALLGAAVAHAERVILPVIPRVEGNAIVGESVPIEIIGAGALAYAQIQSQTDQDGVLRSTYLMGGAGAPRYRLLGYEALVQSGLRGAALSTASPFVLPPGGFGGVWQREQPFRIPYAGPPGHFPVVPYINVLRGDVSLQSFRNKIVLVGMTAGGLGDEFPTPVSGETRAMPGVEIHANVLQALAEGVSLSMASSGVSAAVALLCVTVVMCGFLWLTPRHAIVLAAGMLLFLVISAALLFRFGCVWVGPTLAFIAVALSYPLWSWRKLEATQRYFDAELARLRDEPDVLPAATIKALPGMSKRRAFASVPDVIEQRIQAVSQATERLRNLKRFVADSLESLPTATLVVAFDGKVLLSNSMADRLLAEGDAPDPQPLEGAALAALMQKLRPEEAGTWEQLLPQLLRADTSGGAVEGAPVTVEAKTMVAVPERDCVVQFASLANHVGQKTGLIVTIADITPLRESERRRDEALRFLSHDMRSPQASIITLLEMVREDPGSISQETLLERIGKYSRRTLNLADDFLRLAKAERAKASDFAPLELTEILQDVADEGDAMARGKSMRVEVDADVEEAWVLGDRDLLTRAVVNLMSNAIKYSPDSTTVQIRLRADNASERSAARWRIDVSDEGFGIAPENLSRLFMRFQRLHQEGQPKADGIGLGLVFVKTVIERMGGEVRVASQVALVEGDPHGTTFSILLPQVDPDA